ncbi:hypothetical protein B9Z55_011597 [Caenorhabditis nigoni]|uniref:Uncharacterized protein n=1 Tax=Caenorhabditis nigoni TaxID=1611254 RepID=A0A2G5UKU0_9PELO|nr:hypothetical protein B9Z55_011597 [Caenorhabditis nigoni]
MESKPDQRHLAYGRLRYTYSPPKLLNKTSLCVKPAERVRTVPKKWSSIAPNDPKNSPKFPEKSIITVSRKPVKAVFKTQPTPSELLRRKQLRQSKIQKSRRDEFMETHDYLQDFYYWRSAARINPNKDWKIEALRSSILTEKKRRVREKTQKIREARAHRFQTIRRKPRGVPVEEFEGIQLNGGPDDVMENGGNPEEHVVGNRRTMGAEFKNNDFVFRYIGEGSEEERRRCAMESRETEQKRNKSKF